jgi:hypothetical protein
VISPSEVERVQQEKRERDIDRSLRFHSHAEIYDNFDEALFDRYRNAGWVIDDSRMTVGRPRPCVVIRKRNEGDPK